MLCPNCKKEIENGAVFCEHCGTRIKKSKKGLWITLSVIIVAVVTTIVVITIQEQMTIDRNRVEQHQLELEQQLQAERKAREEAERQAELARQEAARKEKTARKAREEADRKARKEAERQAELARQEAARKEETARKAREEAERQSELARQAEIARQREARRQELLSQGLVDLGLPSGTLWKNSNEGGDNARYTYNEAVSRFGNKLPTKQQLEELKNKCTWTWTGSGYKVIGPNGNSIYLPAAGLRDHGVLDSVGSVGRYWSSTPYASDYAWALNFWAGRVHMDDDYRYDGYSVRLVQ